MHLYAFLVSFQERFDSICNHLIFCSLIVLPHLYESENLLSSFSFLRHDSKYFAKERWENVL